MAVPNVTSPVTSPAATTDYTPGSARIPMQTLGQNDFLKLLVTRLAAQDPLNPQGDQEFIAQMAQFSALENAKAMQAEISALRGSQEFFSANNLIGREVSLADGAGTLEGLVTGVNVNNGVPMIVVDGRNFDLTRLNSISTADQNSDTTATA